MEKVSCDLCGGTGYTLYLQSKDYINKREGIFSVVRCNNCGLIFTNPRPDKTEISEFYPSSTHYFVFDKNSLNPMRVVTGIYKTLLQYFKKYFPEKTITFFYRILIYPLYLIKKHKFDAEAIPSYVEGGKLLEIGCSYGKYLYEMKKLGWEVSGLEMNKEAVNAGRDIFTLDLINKNIDEVEFEEELYDVVVMKMVLEHLYSPDKILKNISKWLKNDGQCIVTIPDISGFEARLFGQYFYSLHLPNHLYHFSPETLKKYFKKNGLKICKIHHHRTDGDFFGSLNNFLTDRKSFSALKILKWSFLKIFIRFFLILISIIYRTGRMTVFAVKEGK